MKNKLMTFESETFGKVRTLTIGGEAWFVAADVCKALELGNPSMTVERLDDAERSCCRSLILQRLLVFVDLWRKYAFVLFL